VIATELAQFYKDFVAGKRRDGDHPAAAGRWTAVDFIGWVCDHNRSR
jgi:hypothetical protein